MRIETSGNAPELVERIFIEEISNGIIITIETQEKHPWYNYGSTPNSRDVVITEDKGVCGPEDNAKFVNISFVPENETEKGLLLFSGEMFECIETRYQIRFLLIDLVGVKSRLVYG